MGHQGKESKLAVIIGEDDPLGVLPLEVGEGGGEGIQEIHGLLAVLLMVKSPQIGIIGVKFCFPSVFQVESVCQQSGGVSRERLG